MEAERSNNGEPQDHEAEEEAGDVWQSFAESVRYMREVADLYQDAFTSRKRLASSPSKSHIQEAQRQAEQAIELLATNLLNAATFVSAAIDEQEDTLAHMNATLVEAKERLREHRAAREQQQIDQFYASTCGIEWQKYP